jgi:thiol-disulfide isomerase/thioredoxin
MMNVAGRTLCLGFCMLLALVQPVVPIEGPVPDGPGETLHEGWRRDIAVEALTDDEGVVLHGAVRYSLRVDQGWLVVRHEVRDGEVDWEIVLARASDPTPPTVQTMVYWPMVDVVYGEYFVREDAGQLRIRRERKTAESPAWPSLFAPADDQVKGRAYSAEQTLICWQAGDWWYAGAGPVDLPPDVVLRVEHCELAASRTMRSRGRIVQLICGERRVQDEGDLLVADRPLVEEAMEAVQARRNRAALAQGPAPELVFRQHFNQPAAPSLAASLGKVVLLDFWGTWCLPCVKSLPEIQRLHEKYADAGLVVLGVHTRMGSEKLPEFLQDRRITFPVVVDTDETMRRFGVTSFPTYFLLDGRGMMAWGSSSLPPTEDDIERLLAGL